MFEFNRDEWAALQRNDERNYVDVVRDDLVRDDPALANDATLPERLMKAWDRAKELRLKDECNVLRFLQLEAYAPEFWRKPAIDTWMRKIGATSDDRFEALHCVTKLKLQERRQQKGNVKKKEIVGW